MFINGLEQWNPDLRGAVERVESMAVAQSHSLGIAQVSLCHMHVVDAGEFPGLAKRAVSGKPGSQPMELERLRGFPSLVGIRQMTDISLVTTSIPVVATVPSLSPVQACPGILL